MSRTYTLNATVEIFEIECEIEIAFTYVPGTPETGPSYASGGEPAVGPEIEVVSVRVNQPNKGVWVETGAWFDDLVQDAINSGVIDADDFTATVSDADHEQMAAE